MTAPALDLDLVRSQFPAYDEGNPLGELAFFEAAGGSFPCRAVTDRLTAFYTSAKVQPGHRFEPSRTAAADMASTHEQLARWAGVTADEVHIGPSTTQFTYVLANAYREVLGPGDAVVITDQAHEANAGPWDRLRDVGVDVRVWRIDPTSGSLDLDGLRLVLDGDVAVVAFPHVSNLLGEPNDVAGACALAAEVDATSVVDGVASAPHGLPWVPDLGADVYLYSTYKTFGPHQGVALIAQRVLDELPNQGHFFNADIGHKRLVPAGPDHAQVAALGGVCDYLEWLHDTHHPDDPATSDAQRAERTTALIQRAEAERLTPLLAALDAREDVRVLGSTDPSFRHPTVAVQLDRPADPVAAALGERGVACGSGHFYSLRLVRALDVDPATVLRLSFTHTTAPHEVDLALESLGEVLGQPASVLSDLT